MNTYIELKSKQQEEFNNFPMFFAFDNKGFNGGMQKLGLKENETDKIYSIGLGGYIRKSDAEAFKELHKKHNKEMTEAQQDDTFIYDMFVYELNNHEYAYTMEVEDTLNALGLTYEEVKNDKRLFEALQKAKKYILNAA